MPSKEVQLPVSPHIVNISPSTCHDLSLFKEILKEYRRLDDTIGMRLNRANATMRDKQRINDMPDSGNIQDQACAHFWRELVGNWDRRTQLVNYCSSVVNQSLKEKKIALENHSDDPAAKRAVQAEIFAAEVKRNQVQNELTVENIVRKRSLEAFRSRCQYFVPPVDDPARKLWESTSR